MNLDTARFGRLEYRAGDLLLFPAGLIRFEHLHAWLLLDEQPLMWLQAVEDAQIAVPLVCPFHYVPEYRLQLAAADCRELDLAASEQAAVLVMLEQEKSQWSINLRTPVILRPDLRLGKQVVVSAAQPLRHVLPRSGGMVRKCA